MEKSMKSWDVKNEAVLDELVQLMGLTQEERDALAALRSEVEAVAPDMVKEFHGRVTTHENTKEYFEGKDVHQVGKFVAQWFIEIFGGVYDAAYAKKRMQIGQTHVRIGLPVRYPLAMLDVVMRWADQVTAKSSNPALADVAFKKVLSLDIAVFNQAYEDAQLSNLSELVGGERLARRLLASD